MKKGDKPRYPDKFFKALFDNMQIGVIVADSAGFITYINQTYARFLDIDAQRVLGQHATELVPNTRLHIVAKTGRAEINYPHKHKGTGYLVHRVPIKENGVVVAVLGLVLFDSATTAIQLAEKLSYLEEKLKHYQKTLSTIHQAIYSFDQIAGSSASFAGAKKEAAQAATTSLPVLITGESGTGKELFAHAIHQASARSAYPFVKVNCAAIPKDLLESELFGYEKGAFTGADPKGKIGKFEIAHMGTIFLDEIGDMPLEMQPKLLRILEMKEVERLGSNKTIHTDFRVIAATNQDIEKFTKSGMFRSDLYFRLNAIQIILEPLRKRKEDIIPLAYHFIQHAEKGPTGKGVRFRSKVRRAMENYDWPGNGRELKYFTESLLFRADKALIEYEDLPNHIKTHSELSHHDKGTSLRDYLKKAEKIAILEALADADNNKTKAADLLGIHRTLLYRKMKQLGIVPS